jgi:ABC-2 type transport system permease protein
MVISLAAWLYAAELIWREHDTQFSGIHDALPISETTDWFSKLFALCFVEFVLLTITGLCGILMQTIAGYHHYELFQYVKELYFITFPQILTFVLYALFVQTVVSISSSAMASLSASSLLRLSFITLDWRAHSISLAAHRPTPIRT